MGKAAVFFDRDGVLNELVVRDGIRVSPRTVQDFRLVADAVAVVERLRGQGLLVFVVTNQPDIARGRMSMGDLDAMTTIRRATVAVDDIAVCTHDDADGCGCRKPLPGLLMSLARTWDVDLGRSFMVGDSWKDVQAGRVAGCFTILVDPLGRNTAGSADIVVTAIRDVPGIVESRLAPAEGLSR
jgi:D-glycero-D-manno-heptose 1,7-bisphosphate phosphatase